MNVRTRSSLLVPIFFMLLLSGCSHYFSPTLSVAVSSNFKNAFEELSSEFHRATGITLRANFGRSDTLASQIEHGEPFDLFLSSDTTLTRKLYDERLATTEPEVFAHEGLMLWSTSRVEIGRNLWLLVSPSIHRIAIIDPKVELSGQIAIKMLQREHLLDSLKSKIVFAASCEEVNRLVATGAAEAGINLASTMRIPLQTPDLVYIIANWQHEPMPQSVTILRHGSEHHLEAAQAFVSFLESPYGKDLLERHMYE